MRSIAAFACLAALTGGSALAQPGPGATVRTVQLELRQGGHLLGSPSVTLQPGRSAAVSVGLYSLRLRLERAAGSAAGDDSWLVRSTVYRADGSGDPLASPAVTLADGEQARLRIASGDGTPILYAVTVR